MHDFNELQKPTHKIRSARSRKRALNSAMLEALEMRQLLSGAVVSIAALDSSAAEASLATGKFRLTRDDTTGTLDVTVALSGTATNSTDYNSISTTVSFADGVATADVTVTPKEDTTYEGSETVIMTVSDGDDYDMDPDNDAATVTIADNEKPTISIEASDAAAQEDDTDETGTFTISRDGPTDGALTVKLTIAGTGTNGTDYNTIATTATIPDGEESIDVTVTGKDDSTLEGTETVKVTIAADTTKYNISSSAKDATVNLADDEVSTVKVAAADATATEGSATDTGKFTITRTGTGAALADALEVTISIAGTATNGTDYDTVSTTVTIPATKATVDVVIKTKSDTDVELGETVKVTIEEPEDDSYLADGTFTTATVNLKDDDKPTVSLEAIDNTASETGSGNTGKFKISRTGTTTETLTVAYTMSGTATKGTDYKAPAATVTIPVGKAFTYVEIKPKDDLALEGTETVIGTLAAGATYIVGSTKTGTVNLTEDELPEVSIKATDAAAAEPGTDKGTFTITRTGPTTAALVVDLDLDGTADAEDDYTEFDDSITIPAGKSSATISVVAVSDTDLEGAETVIVGLAASDAYDVDVFGDEATVTIKDDEKSTVTLTASDSSAAEASSATGTFTITRTGSGAAIADEMKVSFTIAGTATKGTDYATFDTTVTIPAGVNTKTITVTPVDDSTVEGNETVILTLAANAAYTVGTDKTGTVTIAENDKPTVTLTGTDLKATEPTTDKATLTITRNGPTTEALEVAYVVDEDSTAITGTDYDTLTGTATIPAGKSSITVVITPKDDTDVEGNETVIVNLSSDSDYLRDDSNKTATVTIADNDKPTVTLTITDDKADENGESEEEDSAGTGAIKFTRTGATTEALEVLYTVTGTAKTGTDTTEVLTGKVTISAGSLTKTITITGEDDDAYEGDETIIATLKAGTAYTIGDDKTGTVTVVEDDLPTVSLTSKDLSAKEGTTDGIVLTVTRTGATTAALDVDLTTSGTAVGADFTSLPASVTIPKGKSFVSVTLAAKDDSTYEGTESLDISIAPNEDYEVDEDAALVTGTVTDKQLPTVSLEATDSAADEDGNATGAFTFTRSGATTDAVIVNYTITGTAKNGKDYTKIAKTVTIPAGEESKTVTITPKTDTAVEGSETVILTLAKGDYTIDADATTDTVTIADEQAPTISVEAIESTVDETSTLGARFRIWRTGVVSGTTLAVTFDLAGTATLDDDYTIVDEDGNDVSDGSVTIGSGDSYIDIYIKPVNNSVDAADKTVKLTLADGSTYSIDGDATDATITIVDDDLSSSLPTKK